MVFVHQPRTTRLKFELAEAIENWDDRYDEEDFDSDCIDIDEIIGLRRDIEQSQEWTATQNARFGRLLKASPKFAKYWKTFIDAGGITVQDLQKFIDGKLRHKATPTKKHLRLIVSNRKSKSLLRHRLDDPEPEPPCRVRVGRR